MITSRHKIDISETIEAIARLNQDIKALRAERNFFSRSPNFSQHGPTCSPNKAFRQTGVNSPVSLEALRAYQASGAFTPPSSPTEEGGTEATSSVSFVRFRADQARAYLRPQKVAPQRPCAAYSSIGPS